MRVIVFIYCKWYCVGTEYMADEKAWRASDNIGENADLVPFVVVWGVSRDCVDENLTPYWRVGDFLRLLSFTLFMDIAVSVGTVVVSLLFIYLSWAFRLLLSPLVYQVYRYFSYTLLCNNHSSFGLMPTYCPIMLLSLTIFLLQLTLKYWLISTSGYICNLEIICKKKQFRVFDTS